MSTSTCPVCTSPSIRSFSIDADRSCNGFFNFDRDEGHDALAHYYKCLTCNFVRTDHFDQWTENDFAKRIYNADYPLIDPDYAEVRPNGFLRFFKSAIETAGQTVLDYGCGSGAFVRLLRMEGLEAEGYDPFSFPDARYTPGVYDIATCLEVIEHERDPHLIFGRLKDAIKTDGFMLISTLLIGDLATEELARHWYVAPRNGHLSIYSVGAFAYLCAKHRLVLKIDGVGKLVCSARDIELPSFYGAHELSGSPTPTISVLPEAHNYWIETREGRNFVWFDSTRSTPFYVFTTDASFHEPEIAVSMALHLPLSAVGSQGARVYISNQNRILCTTKISNDDWVRLSFSMELPLVGGIPFGVFQLEVATAEGTPLIVNADTRDVSYALGELQARKL